jgi:hypothetical protein
MYESTSVRSLWKARALSSGVVVAQRGLAIPKATLLYCKRSGKSLVTRPRHFYQECHCDFGHTSSCFDVKLNRVAGAANLFTAPDPGAGEAAARRFSSDTVKDEGFAPNLSAPFDPSNVGPASAGSLLGFGSKDRYLYLQKRRLR